MDGPAAQLARPSIAHDQAAEALHRKLAAFNRKRLSPCMPPPAYDAAVYRQVLAAEHEARLLEVGFVEHERTRVRNEAQTAPVQSRELVAWFETLEAHGPGQNDPLFPWLAQIASLEQMKWFLLQETAGEAGFDDLVALTQVRLPTRAKLELARNYWDEMGQGQESGMHGPMLQRLCTELNLVPSHDTTVWESLALGNLMTALASNRRYAYHSIGALGVIELTAPGRAVQVNTGLKRLGVDGAARKYFALHATLDIKHARAWCEEVLIPLVAEKPECAHAIAEGALMRLRAGQRCFDAYRTELA